MTLPRILAYCPLTPTEPHIHPLAVDSLLNLHWEGELDIVFGRLDHKPHEELETAYDEITAKYNAARALAILGGYDALFTFESDMVMPGMTLERLTRLDADVAYGLYVSRRGKHQWLAFTDLTETDGVSLGADPVKAKAAWGQAIETKGIGMGCTLIRRNVLTLIQFRRKRSFAANDWYFALDCQRFGFKQMHDLGAVCGHIDGNKVYWPDPDQPELYRVEDVQ